jgi:hypothetical protein
MMIQKQEVKVIIDQTGIDFGGYQCNSINDGSDVKLIGYCKFICLIIR